MKHSLEHLATRRHARGLTLIELVVVLTILTVLGVAVVSQTAGLLERGQTEQAERVAEALSWGVLGRVPGPSESASVLAPGFVADVGRLPRLYDRAYTVRGGGVAAAPAPAELWDRTLTASGTVTPPTGFEAAALFGVQETQGDSSPEMRMAYGWRGPYVDITAAADVVRDGWRRPFLVFDAEGNPVTSGTGQFLGAIAASRGALPGPLDGDPGSIGLADGPIGRVFTIDSPDQERIFSELFVEFDPGELSEDEQLIVRVYGPINGRPAVLGQIAIEPDGDNGPHRIESVDGTALFTIGPRRIRVYLWNTDGGTRPVPASTQDLYDGATGSFIEGVQAPGDPIDVRVRAVGTDPVPVLKPEDA